MSANVALEIPNRSRLRPCTPWKQIFLVLATAMFSLCSSAVAYGAPTALVAARVIDGRSDTLSKATVVVVDGKTIVAIGGRSVIPADAEVIELATRCSVSRARHQRDPESVATD